MERFIHFTTLSMPRLIEAMSSHLFLVLVLYMCIVCNCAELERETTVISAPRSSTDYVSPQSQKATSSQLFTPNNHVCDGQVQSSSSASGFILCCLSSKHLGHSQWGCSYSRSSVLPLSWFSSTTTAAAIPTAPPPPPQRGEAPPPPTGTLPPKCTIRIIKRIPKASREAAGRRLASIIDSVATVN